MRTRGCYLCTATSTLDVNNQQTSISTSVAGNDNDNNDPLRDGGDVQVAVAGGGGVGSSEGTYVSSLSGSLPSAERSRHRRCSNNGNNHFGNSNNGGGGAATDRGARRRRRLASATRVKNAVSNYELALIDFRDGGAATSSSRVDDDDTADGRQGDVVDLLVAVLTSAPRNLLSRRTDFGEGDVVCEGPRREDDFLASMEQICFGAACIASDVIRRYFQNPSPDMGNLPALEDRHVHELIDEVARICDDADPYHVGSSWSNVDPIVRILNSMCEGRQIERCVREREGESADEEVCRTIFLRLQSKESLRLVHALMCRHLREREDEGVEGSSALLVTFWNISPGRLHRTWDTNRPLKAARKSA